MSKFEPNFKLIDSYLNVGDFGIAKRLFDETMSGILASIDDPVIKKQFQEFSVIPYSTGSWAIERSVISSMMEAQKGSVLLALTYLKIFGELEYAKIKLSSGPNPETRAQDYLPTYRRAVKALPNEYRGGFTEVDAGKMPNKILLGKYHENGNQLNPTTDEKSGKIWIGQWPQYADVTQYSNLQINDLKAKLASFKDEDYKEQLITKRSEALATEFNEINSGAFLKSNGGNLPSTRKKSFQPQNIKNQDNVIVTVNIEDKYDITITETEVQEGSDPAVKIKHFLIDAKLKPEVRDTLSGKLINNDGTKKNQPNFIAGTTQLGTLAYVTRVLPILLKDGVKTLVNLTSFIAENNRIVGEILSKRVNMNFEFMDPEIKNKNNEDPLKMQYYSNDKMIFNGQTRFTYELLDINFKISDAIPSFSAGEDIENDPQLKFVDTILAFMSIPINTYTKLLEVYKEFLLDLMNPVNMTRVYNQFPTMSWLKELVTKEEIMALLGSTDGEIETTKLFDPVTMEWDKSITDKSKEFYEELINKYIEQVSAIYNTDLTKIKL